METDLVSNEPNSEPVVPSTEPVAPSIPSESVSASANPPSTEISQEEVKRKNKGKRKKSDDENAQPDNKRSGVWQHFTRDKVDPNYATCDYCTRVIKCPSKNGTSALHNHLARCKKYPFNIDEKQKLLFFKNKNYVQDANDEGSSSFVPWEFKQDVCKQHLARMVILNELPFMTAEHEGFQDFVNMLQPRFKIPSRASITEGCVELYKSEKEGMKKYFAKSKQRVSLTTDLWSSRQNLSYMCLTVHFIDQNWTLHKRLLNFCQFSGHSGEIIGKYVEKNLLDWGIDKVLTITVDNASSNDLCLRYLKRRLNIWNKSVLESEHLHMRCSAHILSLVVKEGLKEVDGSIVRIRSAVKYVRSSPARLQCFKECVEKAKIKSKSLLCLDVETRWNSTYLMLESSIKFQSAFDLLEEQDSKYRTELLSSKGMPSKEDWEYARCLLPFLKGFYNSTLRLSGSLYVTSNRCFHEVFGIGAMIKKRMKDGDANIRKMAGKMKEKYDKYWGNISNMNMFLFIGPVLDPRYKLDYVNFTVMQSYEKEMAESLCEEIKSVLDALFDHYSNVVGVVNVENTYELSEDGNADAMDVDDDPTTFLSNEYKKEMEQTSPSSVTKTELERYLAEQCEPIGSNLDLLGWWKKNEARFSIMATMARDILAIPSSTVALESAFSTGGRVLDAFRSSLTPGVVEALVCTQNWLRSKDVPMDIEENLEDLEAYEAELKNMPQALSNITVND